MREAWARGHNLQGVEPSPEFYHQASRKLIPPLQVSSLPVLYPDITDNPRVWIWTVLPNPLPRWSPSCLLSIAGPEHRSVVYAKELLLPLQMVRSVDGY